MPRKNKPRTKRAANRKEWDAVDYSLRDMQIAPLMGVNRRAVAYQRKLRGLPPFPRGGRSHWRQHELTSAPSLS